MQALLCGRALSLAGSLFQPAELIVIPVTEDEDHLLDILSHVAQILAAVLPFLHHLVAILCKGPSVALELSILLKELHLDAERQLRVDLVVAASAVGTSKAMEVQVLGVELAAARQVTIVVDAVLWSITLVGLGDECVLVSLHKVKLRADVSTSVFVLVGVAVVEWVSPVGISWHHYTGELCYTAAVDIAQVDIVLKDASKKVGAVELSVIKSGRLRKVKSLGELIPNCWLISSFEVNLISRDNHVISRSPFRILNVESLLDTVLHDFQSRIATRWIIMLRSDMRSGDLEIGELLKSRALAGTLALMYLHPVQVVVGLFPVAKHKGHLSDLIGHSVKILRAALSVHLDLLPALR